MSHPNKRHPIDVGRVALGLATLGGSEVARGAIGFAKDAFDDDDDDNRDGRRHRRHRPRPGRVYPQRRDVGRSRAGLTDDPDSHDGQNFHAGRPSPAELAERREMMLADARRREAAPRPLPPHLRPRK